MKPHSNQFKTNISLLGRQQNVIIIYGENVIDSENINSINAFYKGSLLKSVMKELEIDSNIDIPINSEIEFKYGQLVNDEYEYVDFGKYIVTKSEKQEDTHSYLITAYDKLVYSMKDYEAINVEYPVTIKNYLKAICEHLNIVYNDTPFANENREIANDLYVNIGYTFRDVLDEISQVAGGSICINSEDKLEVRYINDTQDTIDEEYLKDINVNFGKKYGPVNSLVLSRAGESDNIYLQDETSIANNGLCEIKISENQIMNFNDRSDYLNELFEKINGVEYYLNDFISTGIVYYDFLDKYNVKIGETTYSCLMLNDECDISQGLEELIYTEQPEYTKTDYTKADKTDRKVNQTYIIANKQAGEIESLVSTTREISAKTDANTTSINNNHIQILNKFADYTPTSKTLEVEQSVRQLQTDTYTKTEINTKLTDGSVTKVMTTSGTFDEDGMHYEKTGAKTSSTINQSGVRVDSTQDNKEVLYAGYDESLNASIVRTENLTVRTYFVCGSNSRFEDFNSSSGNGTGVFIL